SASRVTRLKGGFKVLGGAGGFAGGAALCATIIGCIIGGPLMVASADVAGSGVSEVVTGDPQPTFLGQIAGPEAQSYQEDVVSAAGVASPAAQLAATNRTVNMSRATSPALVKPSEPGDVQRIFVEGQSIIHATPRGAVIALPTEGADATL